jgi:hypothetical protein
MYKCRNCKKTFEELNKTGGCPFCGFYCSALTEKKTEKADVVGLMMDFEEGHISTYNFYKLFSHLIKTGLVWQLHGSYGRIGKELIESGHISKDGTINWNIIGED